MTEPKKILVLDLDLTLLCASKTPFPQGQFKTESFYIALRPGITEMLTQLKELYHFVPWSNTDRASIDEKLSVFWPQHIPILDIFCHLSSGKIVRNGHGERFFKEVRKIAKRYPTFTMDDIVGIDDAPETYARNYGNVIRVSPFRGDADRELYDVAEYLIHIARCPSFRALEKRHWKADLRKIRYEADQIDLTP